MRQTQMLQIAMTLRPGEAIKISAEDMMEAASGNLSSLLFDSVRRSDVLEFAGQVRENWGVDLYENHENMDGHWTMKKL